MLGPSKGTFGATGHTHTDEAKTLAFELLHPTFGVVIVGVASINKQIALFEIGRELINNGINGGPRLHHHQNPAGAFKLADEIFEVSGALNVLVFATPLEEVLGFGVGAVVDDAGKTVALRIKNEVLAHHAKTDEAEVRLGHGLEDHRRLI